MGLMGEDRQKMVNEVTLDPTLTDSGTDHPAPHWSDTA